MYARLAWLWWFSQHFQTKLVSQLQCTLLAPVSRTSQAGKAGLHVEFPATYRSCTHLCRGVYVREVNLCKLHESNRYMDWFAAWSSFHAQPMHSLCRENTDTWRQSYSATELTWSENFYACKHTTHAHLMQTKYRHMETQLNSKPSPTSLMLITIFIVNLCAPNKWIIPNHRQRDHAWHWHCVDYFVPLAVMRFEYNYNSDTGQSNWY